MPVISCPPNCYPMLLAVIRLFHPPVSSGFTALDSIWWGFPPPCFRGLLIDFVSRPSHLFPKHLLCSWRAFAWRYSSLFTASAVNRLFPNIPPPPPPVSDSVHQPNLSSRLFPSLPFDHAQRHTRCLLLSYCLNCALCVFLFFFCPRVIPFPGLVLLTASIVVLAIPFSHRILVFSHFSQNLQFFPPPCPALHPPLPNPK